MIVWRQINHTSALEGKGRESTTYMLLRAANLPLRGFYRGCRQLQLHRGGKEAAAAALLLGGGGRGGGLPLFARVHRLRAPASPPGCSSPPGIRTCSSCPVHTGSHASADHLPVASYAPCLLSGLCSPVSLLFLCSFPSSSVSFPVSRALFLRHATSRWSAPW